MVLQRMVLVLCLVSVQVTMGMGDPAPAEVLVPGKAEVRKILEDIFTAFRTRHSTNATLLTDSNSSEYEQEQVCYKQVDEWYAAIGLISDEDEVNKLKQALYKNMKEIEDCMSRTVNNYSSLLSAFKVDPVLITQSISTLNDTIMRSPIIIEARYKALQWKYRLEIERSLHLRNMVLIETIIIAAVACIGFGLWLKGTVSQKMAEKKEKSELIPDPENAEAETATKI
jgi:hypothetical protein